MKKNFEDLLKLVENYVNMNIETRGKIAKINDNGDYSHEKKETDTTALKEQLVHYGKECIIKADTLIDAIIEKAGNTNDSFELGGLSGLFAYLQASGSKSDRMVVLSQIKPYRGNLTALKAVYDVAENNEAGAEVKGTIKGYLYNLENVQEMLKEHCRLVFIGTESATDCAGIICRQAEKLGIDLVSDVKDEYADIELLRKMFGLS